MERPPSGNREKRALSGKYQESRETAADLNVQLVPRHNMDSAQLTGKYGCGNWLADQK